MNKVTLTKKEFKTAMEILNKVSKDEVRPILQCVNFKDNTIVALDGYRLGLRKIKVSFDGEFNLLGKDLKEVVKAVKKDIAFIEINPSYTTVEFILLDKEKNVINTFNIKYREGNYIRYSSLIPSYNETTFAVDPKEVLEVIKENKLEKSIAFEIKNNEVFMLNVEETKNNSVVGEKLNKELYGTAKGKNLIIAVNPKYIKESLKDYESGNIIVETTSAIAPIVVKSLDGNKLDLILPIRLTKIKRVE